MTSSISNNGDSVSPASAALAQKIDQYSAKVGVIGLGYVGVPTMVACAQAGFTVTGIDVDQERVDSINAGVSYIQDVESNTLAHMVQSKCLYATSDYGVVKSLDILVICVPTPVDKHKEPELNALQSAVDNLSLNLGQQQLIILQSTTYPGTTEELVMTQLQQSGQKVGQDFFLAFSPERIDYGNQEFVVRNIPKVVGGVTQQCTELTTLFFSKFVGQVIPVNSPKIAEMTKLLENVFRSVNIALVNELSEVCHRMDIDIWEVINAASSKPFGFMPFYPGIGVGGHCIPVDPFYLSWKAKEYDCYVNFIELAARINDNQPYYAVSRIVDILGDHGKPIKNARLLLLGVSFKKDVQDTRNSPALRVAELLVERGADITYSDQNVPQISLSGKQFNSMDLAQAALHDFDATVILVNHSCFNLEAVVNANHLVIDAVDATRSLGPRPTVVKL